MRKKNKMSNKFHKCSCCFNQQQTSSSVRYSFLNNSTTSSTYALNGNANPNNSNLRNVFIVLLDGTLLEFSVETKCSIGELFQRVSERLDLKEGDIFGLAQKIKNEYHFLSSEEKIIKLINLNKRSLASNFNLNGSSLFYCNSTTSTSSLGQPMTNQNFKQNNSSHGFTPRPISPSLSPLALQSTVLYETDPNLTSESSTASLLTNQSIRTQQSIQSTNYQPINYLHEISSCTCSCYSMDPYLTLYFRVKFYVENPIVLSTQQTRHMYYLQLRNNYLTINNKLSEEKYFWLASLAIVADHGVYNPEILSKFDENYIYENMPNLHKQASRYHKNAQNKFCMELSNNNECSFNFNLYNVYKNKEETPGTISIGIASKGILVFEVRQMQEINLMSTFLWPSVSKLNSDKKKFEILINTDTKRHILYKYYTNCEKFSKYLLDLCKQTHAFSNNIFVRLAHHKALTNYVNESYSENVLAHLNDSQSEEMYQEREINDAETIKEPFIAPCVNTKNIEDTPNNIIIEDKETNVILVSSALNSNNETNKNNIDIKHESLSTSFHSFSSNSNTSSSFYSNPNESINKIGNINFEKVVKDLVGNQTSTFQHSNENLIDSTIQKHLKQLSQPSQTSTSSSDFSINQRFNNKNYFYANNEFLDDFNNLNQYSNETYAISSEMMMSTNYYKHSLQSPSYYNQNNQNSTDLAMQYKLAPTSPPLSYRQTISNLPTISSNQFQIKQFKSYVPPPPPPIQPQTQLPTELSTINTMPHSFSSSSLPAKLVNEYYLINDNNNNSNDSICQHYNTFSTQQAVIAGRRELHHKLKSPTSFSSLMSKNANFQDYFGTMAPYMKYRKPPSYEESIRKLKKFSNSNLSLSSSSSYCNEDTDSSISSSQYKLLNATLVNKLNINSKQPPDQVAEEITTVIDDQLDNLADSEFEKGDKDEEDKNDNSISITVENIEQIKKTAAIMSLPLLTGLCNDKVLIRSLSKCSKKEESF